MIFPREFLIRLRQIDHSLNQTDDGGNPGPGKQNIQNSLADLTEIEFVSPDPAEKNSENSRGDLGAHRPGGIAHILIAVLLIGVARICPGVGRNGFLSVTALVIIGMTLIFPVRIRLGNVSRGDIILIKYGRL